MTTIVMPTAHPVSTSFSIAGYRDVDAASDQSAYFGYLDSVAEVFREVIASGIDRLRLRSGDSVVDVGCGHGASAALLAHRVGPSGRVVGIDASHAMIAEARRRYDRSGLPVEFQVGDALALPCEDVSFDAARADRASQNGTIEWVSNDSYRTRSIRPSSRAIGHSRGSTIFGRAMPRDDSPLSRCCTWLPARDMRPAQHRTPVPACLLEATRLFSNPGAIASIHPR